MRRLPPETRDGELVERLLASQEFGANWANYWTDVIAFHVPPPELTYLNYQPLKEWLAGQFNANRPWDEVVRELITAKGKIADHPAATFVGYHDAVATNLAGETARIFLSQQIGCASATITRSIIGSGRSFTSWPPSSGARKSSCRKTTARPRSSAPSTRAST